MLPNVLCSVYSPLPMLQAQTRDGEKPLAKNFTRSLQIGFPSIISAMGLVPSPSWTQTPFQVVLTRNRNGDQVGEKGIRKEGETSCVQHLTTNTEVYPIKLYF